MQVKRSSQNLGMMPDSAPCPITLVSNNSEKIIIFIITFIGIYNVDISFFGI